MVVQTPLSVFWSSRISCGSWRHRTVTWLRSLVTPWCYLEKKCWVPVQGRDALKQGCFSVCEVAYKHPTYRAPDEMFQPLPYFPICTMPYCWPIQKWRFYSIKLIITWHGQSVISTEYGDFWLTYIQLNQTPNIWHFLTLGSMLTLNLDTAVVSQQPKLSARTMSSKQSDKMRTSDVSEPPRGEVGCSTVTEMASLMPLSDHLPSLSRMWTSTSTLF